MSNYKAIVTDMDDTLLNSDNEVSSATQDYLVKVQEAGYHLILASGRPTEGMLPTARDLQMDRFGSYLISYNGGQTIKVADESVEVSQTIDKDQYDEIIDYLRDQGFFKATYKDGYIIYEGEHEYMNIESELTGLPMKQVDDIKAYIQEEVPKVLGVGYESNIKEAYQSMEDQHFNDDIDVTMSKPFFLEFIAKDVSKGNAIQQLTQKLDFSMEEIVAFGDSTNDLSMLKEVGCGVAMDNASDEVKDIADKVTLSHNDDGIPHALKELGIE
ncbi:Cof-type HAD-IIB family hydrolase [Staphylococcus auricularis]|uniref:Cof-type HAD-IIB family hydrolase n=1 Tax=Staphylococcus auricularis TaxID=29379 RepID=A0AAP8TU58_9STAP|nr:Cof-type HAD-IIB family hydrolase [Staphylococcus auricularis]PNZ69601.1 Cof-type HAD-IIB family hydrolase [Staphylococcus auricularis]QPT05408.1 Cof-type HAD-IIB family hydrolase [Staphylococcus auricularis]BCU52212.1 Cof-type HAD-IIB family hydrolase [Staphylococcus auricularis]SQJ11289.1 HAD superfamily hydrolase [Staphylococcus auricularis]